MNENPVTVTFNLSFQFPGITLITDSTKYASKNRDSACRQHKQEGSPLGEGNQKGQYKVSEVVFA